MSANDTLVQLDSDETNDTTFPALPHLNGRIERTARLPSPPAPVDAPHPAARVHISAPLLSTVDDDQRQLLAALPLATDPAAVTQTHLLHTAAHHQHHRRAFSDDRQRGSAAAQPLHTLHTHSSQHLSEFEVAGGAPQHYNLINLAASTALDSSSDDEAAPIIGAAGHAATEALRLHSADDTVEISLLGDTSMDSRESQPLLGCGRDAQDYVYNNFPGESADVGSFFFTFCFLDFFALVCAWSDDEPPRLVWRLSSFRGRCQRILMNMTRRAV